MTDRLEQHEFEALSAWWDGELPPEQAADIERRVDTDPRWASALADLQATDRALDAWTVPAPSTDLSARILAAAAREAFQASPQRSRVLRFAYWAVPAAAAAAVILALGVLYNPAPRTPGGEGTDVVQQAPPAPAPPAHERTAPAPEALVGLDRADSAVVANLDLFRDMDVIENLDTLQAIERLEGERTQGRHGT